MALSLEAARAATRRGDWHLILGLSPPFAERDVHKARRELQRHAHQDKGGNPELSALINKAAAGLQNLGVENVDLSMRMDPRNVQTERSLLSFIHASTKKSKMQNNLTV